MSGDSGIMRNVERCLIGYEENNSQFICYNRYIASKNQMISGLQNGATKQFLAPTVVKKQEYAYFSTTILTCKFKGSLLIR